jgi:hypothetical protein
MRDMSWDVGCRYAIYSDRSYRDTHGVDVEMYKKHIHLNITTSVYQRCMKDQPLLCRDVSECFWECYYSSLHV